jgi:transcription elongation factor GreA
MPIRISDEQKKLAKDFLEKYNETLSLAQKDSTVDLSQYVARVKFDGFEDLKAEPEYSDLEVLTGERDAFQNIILNCETAKTDAEYPKISLEKYVELVVELRIYKNVKRRKNVRDIKTAREFGDLSENAEYQIAREQQGIIESHIADLEKIVDNCEIVQPKTTHDVADIGAKITIESVKTKAKVEFELVGSSEADINSVPQKISNASPIGRAVNSKKVGETVCVVLPKGKEIYKIIEIK